MSASSPTTPTDTESTNHDSPATTKANVPPVVEDTVDAEINPNILPVATNAPTTGTRAPVPTNPTATNNVPGVVTDPVLPNTVVLPNRGIDLALSAHRNGRRRLSNPAGVVYGSYQRRPTITALLDFSQKLHKAHFSERCKKFLMVMTSNPKASMPSLRS